MVKAAFIGLILMLGLSACEDMSDVTTSTRQEVHKFLYGEEEEVEPIVMESRYCYKARADILCYDTPQLGKEEQFLGAQ